MHSGQNRFPEWQNFLQEFPPYAFLKSASFETKISHSTMGRAQCRHTYYYINTIYILWPSGNLVFDFSRIGIAARQWKITFRAYLAVIEQINSENGTIDGFIGILTDCYCDFTLFYCK